MNTTNFLFIAAKRPATIHEELGARNAGELEGDMKGTGWLRTAALLVRADAREDPPRRPRIATDAD